MSLKKWIDSKAAKMDGFDIGLVKMGVAAFILMIAKLWAPILSLDWYWYFIIFILAAIRPVYRIYLK